VAIDILEALVIHEAVVLGRMPGAAPPATALLIRLSTSSLLSQLRQIIGKVNG
jgi:hypothetical protein